MSVYLHTSPPISLSTKLSISLCTYTSVERSNFCPSYLSLISSFCTPTIYLSIYLSLSLHLFIYLSFCSPSLPLSFHQFNCLFFYQFTISSPPVHISLHKSLAWLPTEVDRADIIMSRLWSSDDFNGIHCSSYLNAHINAHGCDDQSIRPSFLCFPL